MNLQRLKQVEKQFLTRYPGGFGNPEMVELAKKHKVGQIAEQVAQRFAKSRFKSTDQIVEGMIKTVTQSSMVSVFEKPRFRDSVRTMSLPERELLAKGLKARLHGNEQKGFETILEMLSNYKLAKWTLITAVPAYFNPSVDVFIKPTTAKKVIANLELDLVYDARPTWEFYQGYREAINLMKTKVSKTLSPNNAAFGGFLMMTLD